MIKVSKSSTTHACMQVVAGFIDTRNHKKALNATARAWLKTAFPAVQTAGIRIIVCPSQTDRFRTYGGWNGNRRYGSDR